MTSETIIGSDSEFSGVMTGQDLRVLGRYEGDMEIQGTLRVGAQGRVKATVRASRAEVEGEFEGELDAGTIVFGPTAKARGRFKAERLSVQDGAIVDGAMNLERPPVAGAPAAPPPAAEVPSNTPDAQGA